MHIVPSRDLIVRPNTIILTHEGGIITFSLFVPHATHGENVWPYIYVHACVCVWVCAFVVCVYVGLSNHEISPVYLN